MTPVEPVVGSLRGFRWWRLSGDGQLLSPWRGPVRAGARGERSHLPRSSRDVRLEDVADAAPSGMPGYPLRMRLLRAALPSINEELDRAIWEIDSATSGGRHGLVLGVVAGYGRTLVGTRGWRSRFGSIIALSRARPSDRAATWEAAATYDVPLYRNLDAMVPNGGRTAMRSPA